MKKLFPVLVMLLMVIPIQGQKKFVVLAEKENVSIQYKWKQYKDENKEEAHKLVLKIKNQNDYPVRVDLEVGYYWDLILKASSEELSYCLKKKKAIIGDMKKGGFDSAEYTYEDLISDKFTLDINSLKVTKVENCKK